jgi:hypothetical protein
LFRHELRKYFDPHPMGGDLIGGLIGGLIVS